MMRQPKRGISRVLTSAVMGKADTTIADSVPTHLPRACGGTNSVIVENPATISAPSPSPMRPRRRISTFIEGAKAEAIEARPKMTKLA